MNIKSLILLFVFSCVTLQIFSQWLKLPDYITLDTNYMLQHPDTLKYTTLTHKQKLAKQGYLEITFPFMSMYTNSNLNLTSFNAIIASAYFENFINLYFNMGVLYEVKKRDVNNIYFGLGGQINLKTWYEKNNPLSFLRLYLRNGINFMLGDSKNDFLNKNFSEHFIGSEARFPFTNFNLFIDLGFTSNQMFSFKTGFKSNVGIDPLLIMLIFMGMGGIIFL